MNKFLKSVLGTSLLLVATLLVANFASCKGNGKKGGDTPTKKSFQVSSVKLWGMSIKDKASETVSSTSTDKSLEIVVGNSKDYQLTWSFKDGETGTANATDGTAKQDPFSVPAGDSVLEIKLTASGFNDWTHSIKVTRKAPTADVTVKLKRSEDANANVITDGNTYDTGADEADLTLEVATGKITSVTGATLTISSDGKSATGKVSIGSTELVVKFEEHKDFTFSFTLKKVEGTLELNATKATIFSGDDWKEEVALSIEKDNEYTEVKPKDVRFSLVKLEMEFDAPITGAEIVRCDDERSDGYAEGNPGKKEDFQLGGVFSGRVIKEAKWKNGKLEVTELNNVVDGKYREYLIVARGAVEYDIKFSAVGRKSKTYTIKINNPLKTHMQKGENLGLGCFGADNGAGLNQTWPEFRWLQYLKAPVNQKDDQAHLDMLSNPEYMGDIVKLFIQGAKSQMGKLGKDLSFFYNVMGDDDATCHDFVRVFSVTNKEKTFVFTITEFDPQEKKVDAFIAFEKALPLPMSPFHLANPFKKLVNKGFTVNCFNSDEIQNKFEDAFFYRIQAKIFGNLNAPGGHKEENAMKISKKQEYAYYLDATKKEATLLTGSSADKKKLAGRDSFYLKPMFKGKFSEAFESITCKISMKNGNGWDEKQTSTYDLAKWDNAPILIVGAKDGWIEKWTGALKDADCSDIFCFEDSSGANIYKVEITTKLKGSNKEEYFDMLLNYKDTYKQEPLGLGATGGASGADMFGLPTHFATEDVVTMDAGVARELAKAELFRR